MLKTFCHSQENLKKNFMRNLRKAQKGKVRNKQQKLIAKKLDMCLLSSSKSYYWRDNI